MVDRDKRQNRRGPIAVAILAASLPLALFISPVSAKSGSSDVTATAGQGARERPGTWELVSVASDGTKGNGDSGYSCARGAFDGATISDDERFVAFSSVASNLDPRDLNGATQSDVFVHDRRSGRTRMISLTSEGALPDTPDVGACSGLTLNNLLSQGANTPHISANGRYVAFADDRNLTKNDQDQHLQDVYVADLRKGDIDLVSVSTSGKSPDAHHPPASIQKPTLGISGNGRYVVFLSRSYELDEALAGDPGQVDDALNNPIFCVATEEHPCATQVFIRDRRLRTTKMVSVSSDGAPADADTFRPSISDDGRYVAFESSASNLSPDDPAPQACTTLNGDGRCSDVFLHDMKTGKTELVSVDSSEQRGESAKGLLYTSGTVITPGGRYVAFGGAGELVPGGGGLLSTATYVRDRKTGRTENVAVTSAGELLETTGAPTISDDGRYVYFVGRLAAGTVGCPGSESCSGRLRYDRWTGQTDWIWIYDVRGSSGTSMGSSGSVFLENTDGSFHDPLVDTDDPAGETDDLFLRDLGIEDLGVGRVVGSRSDPLHAFDGGSPSEGVVRLDDEPGDAVSGLPAAEIVSGTIAYRPELDDLFVRIDVEDLGGLAGIEGALPISAAPLLYGLDITVGARSYQLRISGQPSPRFGLFRCDGHGCTETAQLRGGFGTTGESVVAAIPLKALGLRSGSHIRQLRAFVDLGTYSTGSVRSLDETRLDRR